MNHGGDSPAYYLSKDAPPQYVAFIVIMLGFLLQWSTLVTLAMFPILVAAYVRLALREEREVARHFGDQWRGYAAVTPRWFPRLSGDGRSNPGESR